jgi:CubicO group peptidase (beta-lactamase class C family)
MSQLTRRDFTVTAAAAITASLLGVRPAAAARIAPAIQPPDDSFLAELPALMAVASVPGAGMGVVQNGVLIWHRAVGVMDATTGRAITDETVFPAASLGKPVFAYAALGLAESGRLDLDRPLRQLVPDHAPADPRGDRVTARHVLAHTSGYRNWRNTADQPLVPDFEPGSRFQYSGEGFYYLQRAVEEISGSGFQRFMEQALFEPLGMPDSTYGWRDGIEARLVTGHNRGNPVQQRSREFAGRLAAHAAANGRDFASFTHREVVAAMATLQPAPTPLPNFLIPNSAGGLLTTVRDYAAFLNRVLDPAEGGTGLSANMRRQMLSPQIRVNAAVSWGLGWGLESDRGGDYLWHWGDNGGFKNFVLAHVPSRSGLVVFTNGNSGLRVCERIAAAATGARHLAFDWL